MSSSAKQMRPESGLLNPAIAISNVVLPEPEGPNNVRNSPARTSMLTALSAKTRPYFLVNSVTEIVSEADVSEVMSYSYLFNDWLFDRDI
jgi:hypothetical protein